MTRFRRIGYPLVCITLLLLFIRPLYSLFLFALDGDKYSQILVVPFISIFFIILERRSVIVASNLSIVPAIVVAGSGAGVLLLSRLLDLSIYPILDLDFYILSFLLLFTGGTIFFFGISLIVSNKFPWLLLLLLLPLPSKVLGIIITFFQYGSAEAVDLLLQVTGLNYIRDNLTFYLPSISIHIARECSGIRSSTALFITALLGGHLFLKTLPGKIALLICIIPLTLLKNGIRITTLTVLAEKVDTAWITDSDLHHNGGIVFFGIILMLLFGLLFVMKKIESGILSKITPLLPLTGDDGGEEG
ncbi:MAG: archaeosortase/exosortase family protein [Chitinispirillaceae bacterium]|nr:archaeosortase/exosortase family protein [Chitinispirillaceae bacterium]